MKVKVSLVIALGLFLASVGPLFACMICDGNMWCRPHAYGSEFCMSDQIPKSGQQGSFCFAHGRDCDNWIPVGDCDEHLYPQCTVVYANLWYEPCSEDSEDNSGSRKS